MFRKYLFLGLMAMLLATLVSLVFQGRKREREQLEKARHAPLEIVRTSPSTPTRAFSPSDLVFIERGEGQLAGVQNRGHEKYNRVMLRITYVDGRGKVLSTHDRGFGVDLPPGQTAAVAELDSADAPASWVRRTVRILYAELAPN